MSTKAYRSALATLFFAPLVAHASVLQQLGDQDFVDGHTPVLAAAVLASNAGDPAPFNQFFGLDPTALGGLEFSHTFAPGAFGPATITFGLIDHDSYSASQSTVSVAFDGVLQDTSPTRGISIRNSSVHVVTFEVAPSLLLDGVLTVQIRAILPADGYSGNGIGIDFSRLEALPVPEPSTSALWLLALGGFAAASHARRVVVKSVVRGS